MKNGKVWLVGAGPSDPGLFTLKGKEVLLQADVVVYDRLVGDGVLSMIPSKAECIDVGKRANNHTMPQEEINKLLLDKALEGKNVVRLKGGDPFLFGRGGEELELLVNNQIPFEIVPGITSALSVPAYNGIPVTHRDFSSSVHVITGHLKEGREYDIDFATIAKLEGTLIFLMGVSSLEKICKGLMEHNMSEEMPAALLQRGTSAHQRRIVSTLKDLPAEVEKQGAITPAIIVVGEVCTLASKFSWFEKLPLAGKKILVTRPKEQSSITAEKLRKLGAEVVEVPGIVTNPISNNTEFEKCLEKIENYQWIVFTSPFGVNTFFDALHKQKRDIRSLQSCKFAVIGKGTQRELQARGIFEDFMPEQYDGKSLGEQLQKLVNKGERILIPRAKEGNPELVKALEADSNLNLIIEDMPTYETEYSRNTTMDLSKKIQEKDFHYVVFTSASTVKGFVNIIGKEDFSKDYFKAVCIGKMTEDEALKYGMKTIVSKEATIDSLIELIEGLGE